MIEKFFFKEVEVDLICRKIFQSLLITCLYAQIRVQNQDVMKACIHLELTYMLKIYGVMAMKVRKEAQLLNFEACKKLTKIFFA